MAQNDLLKRYIDAGLAFTALTQARAEALVKDLVKAGRSRPTRPATRWPTCSSAAGRTARSCSRPSAPRCGSRSPASGIATQADLDRIEERIASVIGTVASLAPRRAGQEGAGQEGARRKKATAKKKAPAKKARRRRRRRRPRRPPAKKKAPAKKGPATKKA